MQKHGFTLKHESELPELHSTARLWFHEKSGARLLSMCNKDENKVFGVSFRTPPPDSTGLPHILEHSVLCGSAKYPVKEPFVELLKGSLQTFLNAFTYPDKTCYPVASTNLKDFYNLVDVYLDAVFHPIISEEIFQQEGWHFEDDGSGAAGGNISFKGVVYNEMKGVFSSPEAVLGRESLHALFPDTVYGLESGGDPEDIPTLTYAAFKDFHTRYYHPENGRFYFWGDDPEDERLRLLDLALAPFSRLKVDSKVTLQKTFSEPKRVTLPFAAGDNGNDEEDDSSMFTISWVLPQPQSNSGKKHGETVADVEATVEYMLALRILEHVLLGLPASPLRRALIESGLGEDLAGDGLESELIQPVFSIGLKGIDQKSAPEIEKLILQTLEALAKKGIPAEYFEAAVNSIEFDLRENNTGSFPVGLSVMLQSLSIWLHDDSDGSLSPSHALAPLRYETPLANIKAAGPEAFAKMLRHCFLENKHQVHMLLVPDKTLGLKREEEEKSRLEKALQALPAAEKSKVAENTAKLKAMQEAPDTEEALASIPRLSVADLPLKNRHIQQEFVALEVAKQNSTASAGKDSGIFFHPQPSGEVQYLNFSLSLDAVPEELFPLSSLLGRAMLEMGTAKRDFAELNMQIARKTGGMDTDLLLATPFSGNATIARFCIGGKVAGDKAKDLADFATEVLATTKLNDQERFTQILLEEKARLEHSLIPSGHNVVSTRLKGSLSTAGWLAEQSNGLSYLTFVRALVERAANNWPSVLADLEKLRSFILSRDRLLINLTAEEKYRSELLGLAQSFASALPSTGSTAGKTKIWSKPNLPEKEALITPAQVNYAGKGVNLFELGYKYHGSALVLMKYLKTGWLWEQVRVLGGAYGAFCSLDRSNGALIMASYRDPNILKTLKAFDGSAKHLISGQPSKDAMEKAIIGATGDIDAHLLPEAKGHSAFVRSITGDDEERRQKLREEVLGTTPRHFREFGELLGTALPKARIAALGGNELERVAKTQKWEINKIL